MFTLTHSTSRHHRREFLRIGSLALGGLSLSALGRLRAGLETPSAVVKDKAVVMVFLQGGPSQIETFDPKMTAPKEIRSIFGETPTKLPGVTFGGHFPKLAARADRLAVVRSFASGNGDHQNYLSVAAGNPAKIPMGTLYARVAGANDVRTGMPTNAIVKPESAQPGLQLKKNFETNSLQKLITASQSLGATYSYFDSSGGGTLQQNLELRLPLNRFEDRRSLLAQLDGFQRRVDATQAFDLASEYQQQAYEAILRGVGRAFDLSKEDPKIIDRYDTSRLFSLADVHRWGDMRRSSNLLGKQMLMARRLVEAGCGFVTVVDAGWDMHSNNNSPKGLGAMKWLGPQLDHAIATFLDDIHERGLSDKVLLVVSGEMGRTPKINKNGGRDHWGNLTPLLLAGGGLKVGQVIGQSDSKAGSPASQKYTPQHLFATVMDTILDLGQVRVARDLPNDVLDTLIQGRPIDSLRS